MVGINYINNGHDKEDGVDAKEGNNNNDNTNEIITIISNKLFPSNIRA